MILYSLWIMLDVSPQNSEIWMNPGTDKYYKCIARPIKEISMYT